MSIWDDAPRLASRDAVDRATFEAEVVAGEVPVVLKGQIADWPALAHATPDALCSWLKPFANDEPVETWFGDARIGGRFAYTADVGGFNFERRQLGFGAALDAILSETDRTVFAGAVPLPRVLPDLLAATPMPLLDPDEERLTSLWIGNGSRTIAHWDLPRNLACVIAGRRRFVVLPPDQLRNLYVGPIETTLAGQPASLVDFETPDFAAHPKFRDAIPQARVADLDPGDVLYLPSMWWHYVVSTGFGAQINFWWREATAHMATPLFALYHALLNVRDLPPAERAAWKAHFDHYVFGVNGDPAAHIPEGARGLLGPMTPELSVNLRKFLIQTLGGR